MKRLTDERIESAYGAIDSVKSYDDFKTGVKAAESYYIEKIESVKKENERIKALLEKVETCTRHEDLVDIGEELHDLTYSKEWQEHFKGEGE